MPCLACPITLRGSQNNHILRTCFDFCTDMYFRCVHNFLHGYNNPKNCLSCVSLQCSVLQLVPSVVLSGLLSSCCLSVSVIHLYSSRAYSIPYLLPITQYFCSLPCQTRKLLFFCSVCTSHVTYCMFPRQCIVPQGISPGHLAVLPRRRQL